MSIAKFTKRINFFILNLNEETYLVYIEIFEKSNFPFSYSQSKCNFTPQCKNLNIKYSYASAIFKFYRLISGK